MKIDISNNYFTNPSLRNWLFVFIFFPTILFSQEKKTENKITTSGNVEAGVEYGILPFLVNNTPPQTNYTTNGEINFSLLSLPFTAQFYYSSLGSISGLNNYFTVKFDANKFINDKKEKIVNEKLSKLNKIDSLNTVKQSYLKKIDYYNLILSGKINFPEPANPNLPVDTQGLYSNLDTLNNLQPSFENDINDSINNITTIDTSVIFNSLDTNYSIENIPIDTSINYTTPYQPSTSQLDSIQNQIYKYQSKIDKIDNKIKEYQAYQDINVDSMANAKQTTYFSKGELTIQEKFDKLFSGVKKFDIGMTYPNYSRFLISGIPVRGINLEYSLNNFYLAFTHGKTVNNIFITNDVVNNNLNAIRNVSNFFDFNNIESGRKITSIKTGYGKKNGTHLFVGALKGLGKLNYNDSLSTETEENIVGELDGMLQIGKSQSVQLLYGRSAIQNSTFSDSTTTLFDELLKFKSRTNAIKLKHKLELKNTNITTYFRFIDPFYKSFGVGFLRSDNNRYSISIKQSISKRLDVSGMYRKENDNVLDYYNYQNVITTYGAGFTYRPIKKLMIKGDLRPILQETNVGDTLNLKNNNYISNIVVNYIKRVKKSYLMFTGVNSFYQLSTENGLFKFYTLNLNFVADFNQKVTNTFNYNYFTSSDTSSVPLASILINQVEIKLKKLTIGAKGKISFLENKTQDFGYGLKLHFVPIKKVFLEASIEKIVFGDFYNSIIENTNDFPYYSYVKLGLKW